MQSWRRHHGRQLGAGLLLVLLALRLAVSFEHSHEVAHDAGSVGHAGAKSAHGAWRAVDKPAPPEHDERTCPICQVLAMPALAPTLAAIPACPPLAVAGGCPACPAVFLPSSFAPDRAPRGPPGATA